MTEEQILAATVGERRVHDGPVHLTEYDPAWPERFDREAERIAAALGERALMIEHVGSTSVPGLAAKPTVDILLVVADSADEDAYLPAMEAAGYVLRVREPDWNEHRMVVDRAANVQVHVVSEGCPQIERWLIFRDRLRSDAADRELYERTKRELAARTWRYVQNYADAKGDVVEEIIARARREPLGSRRRRTIDVDDPREASDDQRAAGTTATGPPATVRARQRAVRDGSRGGRDRRTS